MARCRRSVTRVDRSRSKAEKVQETTEEVEFRKQQAMQDQLKQMTRRNQVAMERSRRTAYSGNVRSSKPLTVSVQQYATVDTTPPLHTSVGVQLQGFLTDNK